MIDLYGSKTCIKCRMIKQKLDKLGIHYNEIDAFETQPDGLKQIPSVKLNDSFVYVGDYNESKLKALLNVE